MNMFVSVAPCSLFYEVVLREARTRVAFSLDVRHSRSNREQRRKPFSTSGI
ncbi:unnamed protein product [Ixodes hexagonus]